MPRLPRNFPVDRLPNIDRYRVEWFYRRFVSEYYEHYQFGHFILAAYASVPALITPDLLYKIWQNFHQYIWNGETTVIHRIAVSDILLSPLCREVGHELYEMDDNIRNAFLQWVETESKGATWAGRKLCEPQMIARFLVEYHARLNPGEQRWGSAYAEVQHWNALTFTDPEAAQRQLWERLKSSYSQNKKTEALRVLDFWSKSESRLNILFQKGENENLERLKKNSAFAGAWKALLHHNSDVFLDLATKNPEFITMLDESEGGIAVQITKDLKNRVKELSKDRLLESTEDLDKEPTAEPIDSNETPSSYTNSLGMRFVLIEAGTFVMGSDSGYDEERPTHEVTITKPFYLSETPITQEQWGLVIGANPSKFKGKKLPVEMVSWDEVLMFIEHLNKQEDCEGCYRLPTEAEWEYAARAGTTTDYSFRDNESVTIYAWYKENSFHKTNPVGQKMPNSWGLYDMHGNVSEWVYDIHGIYPSGSVIDPTGPTTGYYRVIRGGSWYDDVEYLRSAYRSGNAPWARSEILGFRLAKVVR